MQHILQQAELQGQQDPEDKLFFITDTIGRTRDDSL